MKTFDVRSLLSAAAVAAVVLAGATAVQAQGRGDGPVIYVESQGLYYDSILTAQSLPPVGPFQELYMGPNGLTTDLGPGDVGYVGGRWWFDENDDGIMNAGDAFFSCPLLAPGRDTP